MAWWLVKSEPSAWSFQDHMALGSTPEPWDGVRNHQAQGYMKQMQDSDQAFFYHSVKGKEIVGLLRLVKTWYPDPEDPSSKFGLVDFVAIRPLAKPVPLSAIRAEPSLESLLLLRQSRLSVMPVPDDAADKLLRMGDASTA